MAMVVMVAGMGEGTAGVKIVNIRIRSIMKQR